MTRYWHALIADLGLEPTIALTLYAALVASCVLALIGQCAWTLAKRLRPRADVQAERDARARELAACMTLTERR